MSHSTKKLFQSAGIVLLCGVASAQRSSNSSASSDIYIVQSTAIYKTADLRFGAIVPGNTAGTVTLSTAGARSAVGAIVLPSSVAYGAAGFVVLGTPATLFSLSLPSTLTLGRAGGSETMVVSSFVSNPSSGGLLSAGGSFNVFVGATLAVGAHQTFGSYTGTFNVTVSFP